MKAQKLRKCPRCSSQAVAEEAVDRRGCWHVYVRCERCGLHGPVARAAQPSRARGTARRAWNAA